MRPLSEKCITFFDFLRFSLAQIVLVGHGIGFFYGYWGGFIPNQVPYPQQIAVVGFFLVSGFLICRSVMANLKYKGADAARYFSDRFSRIYTTLIPSLLLVFVIDKSFGLFYPQAELLSYSSLKIFFNNLLLIPSMPFGTLRPIWSLMFEWWIYIFFGGLVFFRKHWIFATLCLFLGAKYTFWENAKGEAGHLEIIWFTGALGAYYFDRLTLRRLPAVWTWLLFAAAAAIYLYSKQAYNLLAGLLMAGGLVLLAARLNGDSAAVSSARKARWASLAGFSFTLFLTHYSILYWIQQVLGSSTAGFVLAMLLANIVAFFIAYGTERHHKAVSECMLGWVRRVGMRRISS